MLHLALFCSEPIRSDSEWKTLLHFASEEVTLPQSCAEGSKTGHRTPKKVPTCSGKVEFCLTKLQALRANSSLFAAPRLIDVLNAFGLFAHARRDPL